MEISKLVPLEEFFQLINPSWDKLQIDNENDYICIDWFKEFNEFDINPYNFLEFAENDLKSETMHSLVNSLSNSKRAIDCQVDRILLYFGINSKKWSLRNFPSKMKLLQEIGIITPRIVGKVIKARNYLEHKYKCPEKDQVEDAIDIANLFIDASNGKLNYLRSFRIWYTRGHIEVLPDNKHFKLWSYSEDRHHLETVVTPKNKELYKVLLKLMISDVKKVDLKEAFQPFIKLVK